MEQLLKRESSRLREFASKLRRKEVGEAELDILEQGLLEAAQNNIHRFEAVRIGKKHKRVIYEVVPATYYFFPGNKRVEPCFYFVTKNFNLLKFKEDKERRKLSLLDPNFTNAVLE